MRTVRTGPVIGLIAQLVLLGVLAVSVGLGAAGLFAGAAWGVATYVMLARGLGRSGDDRLGPADRVTLTRAMLVGGVTALVVGAFDRSVSVSTLVALAGVALVLDAVDGWVARRTETVSDFGALFDMEVDAFLILVLSVYAARTVGGWVLAIGAARYGFGVAGRLLPWMHASLPARYWRKVVAATQGIVLAVVATGVLPSVVAVVALAGALALLAESFGRDVWWLWRRQSGRRELSIERPEHGIVGTAPIGRVERVAHAEQVAHAERVEREIAEPARIAVPVAEIGGPGPDAD
ncbi:MAG TPA: CDP-alcohol phosphatidyltransferase family protein [Micromonosporaceae bacterium]